jgi:hypothetical protein
MYFAAPEELIHSPGQSGCPTPGCKGIGHIKGAKYVGHHRYVAKNCI